MEEFKRISEMSLTIMCISMYLYYYLFSRLQQFDCGIHPAYSGMAALPYFDEIDPGTIDVLLVTQYVLWFLFFYSLI